MPNRDEEENALLLTKIEKGKIYSPVSPNILNNNNEKTNGGGHTVG